MQRKIQEEKNSKNNHTSSASAQAAGTAENRGERNDCFAFPVLEQIHNKNMELKTKIKSEEGKQELFITREFDLPVELLFKAYEEPELVEQWMGTKVLELENRNHGSYRFETTDPQGNKHHFHGVIHEFIPDKKIIRTFEMANTPFCVQLEFLEFEKIDDNTSKLNMHVIYRSVQVRDQLLKLPFAQGISMAHNRIEELMKKQIKK